ncbi:MAG TPA: hypothetical protein VHW04_19205 [Solirubrobacteraceae bacterium]|nr:hypothetical protein [Solirubrobacteraceae bacterium]
MRPAERARARLRRDQREQLRPQAPHVLAVAGVERLADLPKHPGQPQRSQAEPQRLSRRLVDALDRILERPVPAAALPLLYPGKTVPAKRMPDGDEREVAIDLQAALADLSTTVA